MNKVVTLVLFLGVLLSATSQESKPTLLSLDAAVAAALEYNHDLYVVALQREQAENSATLGNAGALPALRATAGANYSNQNSDLEFATGQSQVVDGAQSAAQNASLALSQILFSGGALQRTYGVLKKAAAMASLQELQQMNATVAQAHSQYYAIALLQETIGTAEANMTISLERYERAKLTHSLGGSNSTELLSAEVALNRDKITLMDARAQLANAKNTFRSFAGLSADFEVTETVSDTFAMPMALEAMVDAALAHNPSLQLVRMGEETAQLQYQLSQSTLFPTVSAQMSYGLNQSQAEAGFLSASQQTGLNAGLTLSYDIFGGGRSRTQRQNAALDMEIASRRRLQAEENIATSVRNAAEVFVNAQAKYELEQKNVLVAQQNFEKTKERYHRGQLSFLEFREAQLGLLNAENGKTAALFQARNAHIALWQLVQAFDL
jgi:outer membrane protein TolC